MPNARHDRAHRTIWLHCNRRLVVVAVAILSVGMSILVGGLAANSLAQWTQWMRLMACGVGVLIGLFGTALLALGCGARIFYTPGCVWIRLGTRPQRIPLSAVEVFFRGQDEIPIPGRNGHAETSNIVVRLADRAVHWHARKIPHLFGNWCDGYITIRGLWCETVHADLLLRLNAALVEAKRQSADSDQIDEM